MKTIGKIIKLIIILVILYASVSTIIDYYRMKNGEVPVFNKSTYDSRKKIQKYKGFIYDAQRKIKTSPREPLSESSNIKFKVLTLKYDIPSTWKEEKKEYKLEINKIDNCTTSTLYYADLNNKIYTYCIEDINLIKDNKKETLSKAIQKDNKIPTMIFSSIAYSGILSDGTTQVYKNRNDGFSSYDITIYQCNKDFINDIYITPREVPFQLDFCTYKDDDLKFIFEIVDESEKSSESTTNLTPEIIYEDDNYRYEFEYPKSQFVFIKIPAVRGKEETKIPLMQALNSNIVTIDEVLAKGLQVNKVAKSVETP